MHSGAALPEEFLVISLLGCQTPARAAAARVAQLCRHYDGTLHGKRLSLGLVQQGSSADVTFLNSLARP